MRTGKAAELRGVSVNTLQRWEREVLEKFVVAKELANVEFVEEVGGGLNFRRKRFLELMDEIGRREINTLTLAHRDRLTRFGFEWLGHFTKVNGCELLALNQERLSPEQEIVQDLMTIVHCFSSAVRFEELPKKIGRSAEEGRGT